MNKTIKWVMTLFVGLSFFSLVGCQNENVLNIGEPFTITFVDYEGNTVDTFACTVGIPCEITPPTVVCTEGSTCVIPITGPSIYDTLSNKTYFTRWSIFESQFSSIQEDTVIKPIYTLSPVAFTIFNRNVVFYSVFIMTGIFIALTLGLREGKRTGLKQDDLIDGFLWIVPVAILGARLWYVVFEWDQFFYGKLFPSLLRVIGFSSGTLDFSTFGLSGLAIHGAFVTAVICAYFFTRKRKVDIFKVIDVIAIGFIIAQAFGRWGNFFNQEAHGGIVGGVISGEPALSLEAQFNFLRNTLHIPQFIVNNMYIHGITNSSVTPFTGYYHPTFFYESMLNILGFFIMLVLRRIKNIHFGELLSFYLIWYGSVRIFIETMRTDPLTFEFLGMTLKSAIVTSTIMILLGILLSLYVRIKRKGLNYGTVPGYFECKRKQCVTKES